MILAASLIINRLVLAKLWQPFYKSLTLIKDYKVGSRDSFPLPETKIEEFAFMNGILKQATLRADHDFLILKEFTENASHEMQTPLAIIRSKLDLMIQDEKMPEDHSNGLQVLYQAVQKLTRLNKSLLLLTKIENNQFEVVSELELDKEIRKKVSEFQEIISDKQLQITMDLNPVKVIMNNDLMDLLLNNILSNSIKHNYTGGKIDITLSQHKKLTISNTGSRVELDPQRIFTRFYKQQQTRDDTGLGLSIIKQICTTSHCTVNYTFTNEMHGFEVEWS